MPKPRPIPARSSRRRARSRSREIAKRVHRAALARRFHGDLDISLLDNTAQIGRATRLVTASRETDVAVVAAGAVGGQIRGGDCGRVFPVPALFAAAAARDADAAGAVVVEPVAVVDVVVVAAVAVAAAEAAAVPHCVAVFVAVGCRGLVFAAGFGFVEAGDDACD